MTRVNLPSDLSQITPEMLQEVKVCAKLKIPSEEVTEMGIHAIPTTETFCADDDYPDSLREVLWGDGASEDLDEEALEGYAEMFVAGFESACNPYTTCYCNDNHNKRVHEGFDPDMHTCESD